MARKRPGKNFAFVEPGNKAVLPQNFFEYNLTLVTFISEC